MSKLYVKSRSRFRTIQTASAVNLPFPIHPQVRLAALNDRMPEIGMSRAFRPESVVHLQGFCPNIVAGTAPELRRLVEQIDLGTVELSCLDKAVIAITRCGDAPVTDVDRVVFWQAFGVPVFEMFVGFDNAILGYECELHEGWHLAPKIRLCELAGELVLDAPGVIGLHTSLSGFITRDKCPCGREGVRLLQIEPIRRPEVLQPWAATA